jgi:hypothetical protein
MADSTTPAPEPLSEEGLSLIKAFMKISDPAKRASVIALAEQFAAAKEGDQPSSGPEGKRQS